jgi:hypothetical protein
VWNDARNDASEKRVGLGIESGGEGHVGLMRGPTMPELDYLLLLLFYYFLF